MGGQAKRARRTGTAQASAGGEEYRVIACPSGNLESIKAALPTDPAELPLVKRLTAGDNQIRSLKQLRKCTGLAHVDLNSNLVGSVQLQYLAPLANLRFLNLNGNLLTDVAPLAALKGLECLLLANNKISDIAPLKGLGSLNTLVLSHNQIAKVDTDQFFGLAKLRKLNLSHNKLKTLPDLTSSTDLNELRLAGNELVMLENTLAANADLSILDLSGNKLMGLPAVKCLAKLQKLRHLSVKNTPLMDEFPSQEAFYKTIGELYPHILSVNGTDMSVYRERPPREPAAKRKPV